MTSDIDTTNNLPSSPVAPAYSPITPKVQPVLPANGHRAFIPPPDNGGTFNFTPPTHTQHEQPKPSIPATQYIKKPPNQPFSGEDATDAIALKAAISTLQIQKKKAQDDIHTLSEIRKAALEDPEHFRKELIAGRLEEQRPKIGDLQSILDEGDDEDDFDMDEMEVDAGEGKRFPRIPGPQNVVRTPHINWEKYHVVGPPLDSMHEQQQRWPGHTADNTSDRGREFSVAAPFSPFLDKLDTQQSPQDTRKDSAAQQHGGATSGEHPGDKRRRPN